MRKSMLLFVLFLACQVQAAFVVVQNNSSNEIDAMVTVNSDQLDESLIVMLTLESRTESDRIFIPTRGSISVVIDGQDYTQSIQLGDTNLIQISFDGTNFVTKRGVIPQYINGQSLANTAVINRQAGNASPRPSSMPVSSSQVPALEQELQRSTLSASSQSGFQRARGARVRRKLSGALATQRRSAQSSCANSAAEETSQQSTPEWRRAASRDERPHIGNHRSPSPSKVEAVPYRGHHRRGSST